jgi:hypothetical protein
LSICYLRITYDNNIYIFWIGINCYVAKLNAGFRIMFLLLRCFPPI